MRYIGISSILDTVFRYFTIFLSLLRYWVPPNVPLEKGLNTYFQVGSRTFGNSIKRLS